MVMFSSIRISKKAGVAAAFCLRRGFSSRPWLMLPPSAGYNYFKSVGEERVVRVKQGEREGGGGSSTVVGSSHGWVARYEERERLVWLSNPITGEHMKLPPLPLAEQKKGFCVDKVILSCSPTLGDGDGDGECRAAMIFDNETLAVCAPGRSTAWTRPIPGPGVSLVPVTASATQIPYWDFVYSQKNAKLFCLVNYDKKYNSYVVQELDLSDPSRAIIEWSNYLIGDLTRGYPWGYMSDTVKGRCLKRSYLAYLERTDELLLVLRYFTDWMEPSAADAEDWIFPRLTMGFDVHVIDRHNGRIPYMDASLGGLALFVGLNETLAVDAADFPGLQPDAIYFTDVGSPSHELDYGGDDIGVFDYKKGTFSSCYYPRHRPIFKNFHSSSRYYPCHDARFNKIHPPPLWIQPSSFTFL